LIRGRVWRVPPGVKHGRKAMNVALPAARFGAEDQGSFMTFHSDSVISGVLGIK
jgi:hypothetical protein